MVARPLVHSLHRWSLEEDVTLLRAAAVMVCGCRWLLLFYVYDCVYVIVCVYCVASFCKYIRIHSFL